MRTHRSIPALFAALLIVLGASVAVWADATPTTREYQLKAAFLYNFLMFVDGHRFARTPGKEDASDPNAPIVVGIVGADPFGQAFEPLKEKRIRNRLVVVKRFKGFGQFADPNGTVPTRHPQLAALQNCHVVFICASERGYVRRLLEPIRELPILTVADRPGFLEAGGMINFVVEEKKVRFEINTAAAERARLQVRSRLLRLARRIVRHGPSQTQPKEDETEE